MKTCTKCHAEKDESEFAVDSRATGKRTSDCKACRKAYNHEHYLANRTRVVARNTAWNTANKDKVRIARHTNYENNRERVKEYHNVLRDGKKATIVQHYGGKCVWPGCGVADIDVLTIDHINNDGAAERRELNERGGNKTYERLIREDFPEGYQVLCANHNLKKNIMLVRGKVCPV
jgi:hypothetical protein